MTKSTICFVNSRSGDERILVTDAHSAEILKRILGRLENEKWVVEGEAPKSAESSAQLSLEMPVVPAKSVTHEIPESPGAKLFRVVLICGSASFRSGVCELSNDGMVLKSQAPAAFAGHACVAYVSHSQLRENVELSCEVSTDGSGVSRLEFVGADVTALEKLSEWVSEATAVATATA